MISPASLASGAGEAALTVVPKIQQPPVARQSHVPTTLFNPRGPMAAGVSYIVPQFNYRRPPQPVRALDTNRNTLAENIPIKEGSKVRNRLIKELFLVAFGMILCGIPLAIISTLYVQGETSCSTTSTSTSITAATSVTTMTMPSQCTSYTTNNDSTRNVAYGMGSFCDNTLTAGWYRFMGGAGTHLATSAVSRDTCATYYGGSYNGSLPSTAGTIMFGTLCLNNNGYICYAAWSGSLIGVTNCGAYYVYYLSPITNCNSRYCTTT